MWKKIQNWLDKRANKRVLRRQDKLLNAAIDNHGLNDTYLFDFKNWASQYNQNNRFDAPMIVAGAFEGVHQATNPGVIIAEGGSNKANAPQKIALKPIDALLELETIPTPFTLAGLDNKIEMSYTLGR